MIARRKFLNFLAASPLFATPTVTSAIASVLASVPDRALAQSYDVLLGSRRALGPDGIITAAGDALNVFEFEPAAKKALLAQGAPAHWGYLESGVDGDVTRDANKFWPAHVAPLNSTCSKPSMFTCSANRDTLYP